MHSFISFAKHLLNFLFPKGPKVVALEKLSSYQIIQTLPRAQLPSKEDGVFALLDYSHPVVKELVWQVKYAGNRVLADRLGEILYDVIIEELEDRNVFEKDRAIIILPMPISDKRRYERGWNQAELVASAIKARDAGQKFKYLPRQLAKIRHTESQTKTASKSERRENLKNSMKVLNPLSVKDRYVVLIDDVITTGSTLREAKRALLDADAKKIFFFAVSH